MAGIADMLIGGFEAGTRLRQSREAEQKQKGLASLYQQAYNAPVDQQRGLVTQAMGLDPQAGMELGKGLDSDNESRAHRLVGMAEALTQTPEELRPQMYAKMLPELRSFGIPAGDQYDPSVMDAASQILAAAYGPDASQAPAGYQQFELMTGAAGLEGDERQRAARIALGLDPRASSAAIQYKEVVGADGRTRVVAFDPRDVGAQVVGSGDSYGSAVQGGDPFGFLAQAGATVTSGLRSPERNAKVGGVPNSYHLTGQARDILPPRDPQQAQFIRQQAAANGLEVIDEGDHWHLEPRGNRANPFVSRRPEDEAAAKEAAERRVGLQFAPAEAAANAERERLAAEAKAGVERGQEQRQRDMAFSQFQTAMQATESALRDTATNPVAGAIPAVTANQQIAEGAVAAMAPILKQLFRSAGEGVFTDKDQELLMAMMPTRSDHPETITAKIANIRAIVSAKLGQGAPAAIQADTQPSGSVLRFNPATGDFE